jgi:hypothetical protein
MTPAIPPILDPLAHPGVFMTRLARLIWFVVAVSLAPMGFSAEIARLHEGNWDQLAPDGKEVDCIYGDYVLRNDRIVCVIANPIAGRNANMTVRNVGGCVIDLTRRQRQSDQLSCYYPGASRFGFEFGFAGSGDGMTTVGTHLEPPADYSATGQQVVLAVRALGSETRPQLTVYYRLQDGWDFVKVEAEYANTADKPLDVEMADSIRADRTFDRPANGKIPYFWVDDFFFRQGYATVALPVDGQPREMTLADNTTIRFTLEGAEGNRVRLMPGQAERVELHLFPADNLLALRGQAAALMQEPRVPLTILVKDAGGRAISGAAVSVWQAGSNGSVPYGRGYTGDDGRLASTVPPGKYRIEATALGRDVQSVEVDVQNGAEVPFELQEPGYVVGQITAPSGGPIPCKVQFIGQEGTKDPYFGPESADTAVRNVVYSHNGSFKQAIGPGKYRVIMSYGPEHDAVFMQIEVRRGEETPLVAKLVRSVQTPGWVSTDYHNHSSPSGDNTSSQLGRVQNILCEQVEFAPCTEHNRVSTYIPHLRRLGVEHLMGTCSGIELTGQPLPLNHQNAFPLIYKPRIQDGGGPQTDADPEAQISRLALWDGRSEKLVQQNHPDLGWLFYDKNGDNQPDSGFNKAVPFMDCIEVHPLEGMLRPAMIEREGKLENNRIFNWLQLLNQGYRITGVVNTDSHYNFHESGFIRNYVKSPTDDPAKIQTLDMVHATERGNVILTTAPFLEVRLVAAQAGEKSQGTAGDDVYAPHGKATLHVRVQCANWYDIDRVQVYLNGRPEEKLNFTRADTPDRFGQGVVKFDQQLALELNGDTHVIVMAVGEKSRLGEVQGPQWGRSLPIALNNPIYVDTDGDGFKANGDTLGAPLPVKGGVPAK